MSHPYSHEIYGGAWLGRHTDVVQDEGQNWLEGPTVQGVNVLSESNKNLLQESPSRSGWAHMPMTDAVYNHSSLSGHPNSPLAQATARSLVEVNDNPSQVFTNRPITTFRPDGRCHFHCGGFR